MDSLIKEHAMKEILEEDYMSRKETLKSKIRDLEKAKKIVTNLEEEIEELCNGSL